MKVLDTHAIYVNSDQNEGRGPMKLLAHFTNVHAARAVVADPRFAQWCVQGVHNPIDEKHNNIHRQTIIVFDNAAEFYSDADRERREKILAKLTPAERKFLGL